MAGIVRPHPDAIPTVDERARRGWARDRSAEANQSLADSGPLVVLNRIAIDDRADARSALDFRDEVVELAKCPGSRRRQARLRE